MSVSTDRRRGINASAAVKVACACATTGNITLSGEQSIDGITTDDMRVFVKQQTDGVENGIYRSSTGAWVREPDFDGEYDTAEGTLILVSRGTANAGTFWRITNTGTITIGTTAITSVSTAILTSTATGDTMPDLVSASTGDGWISILGFHAAGDGGGGIFYYDSTQNQANHDGMTIIDPSNTADLATWDATAQSDWFTAGSGTGCWMRVYDGPINFAWGGVLSDETDQTDLLVTILDSLSETTRQMYELRHVVAFDRKTVINAIPKSVLIMDNSAYDYNASGETTKKVGYMEKGSSDGTFEMHHSIESGHHAVVELNNYGNSGSTSADERKASILWSVGNFTNQGDDKRGYRPAAIMQFTKSTGATFWTWGIRSQGPWEALDGEYELWKTSESITSGDYRYTGTNHYKATTTGTTGVTMPTHTSGTASDGGVTWEYLDSADRSIIQLDQYNRLLIGNGSFGQTFRHKVNATDPNGGAYVMDLLATGATKNSILKLTPTNGSSAETVVPYLQGQADTGLRVMKSDGSTDLGTFGDSTGFTAREFRLTYTTSTDDATPSVAGISTLFLDHTGATTITALDDGSDGQIVNVVVADALSSFTHSSTLMLDGSVNVTTPAAYSSITFQKVPTAISDRWVEIGRSIK